LDLEDTDKSGGLGITEILTAYDEIFSDERKQLALILTPDFKKEGWSLDRIMKALQNIEEALEKEGSISKDEFYQIKNELLTHPEHMVALLKDQDPERSPDDVLLASVTQTLTQHVMTNIQRVSSTTPGNALHSFKAFVDADELQDTLQKFEELKGVCGITGYKDTYSKIKEKTQGDIRSVMLWKLLDVKRAAAEYKTANIEKAKVLIVGAGPGGLRVAVECALLGARTVVVEKRDTFSRHNLLHVWQSSIRDLTNLGAKFFFPQFCTGGINHIAIRRLQLLLLKIALILGVKVLGMVGYATKGQRKGDYMEAKLEGTNPNLTPEDALYNVLIGADGEGSFIGNEWGFERKVFQGGQAIGVTANFQNKGTPEESHLKEFGLLAVYNQSFFTELITKYKIELENLVYYRGETHYFVMTVKRKSLLERGICKKDAQHVPELLNKDNVDRSKLEALVRDIADYVQLPASSAFCQDPHGGNDVSIFDFSQKKQAEIPAKLTDTVVAMVGDSLKEPFWPLGTGANRAILSSLDLAWTIKRYFSEPALSHDALLASAKQVYQLLGSSSPNDIHTNFGLHTIDPKTRYKGNQHNIYH